MISFFFFIKPLVRICGFVFFSFFGENLWPVGFVYNLLGIWACRGLASVTIYFLFFLDFSSNLFFWAFFFFFCLKVEQINFFF